MKATKRFACVLLGVLGICLCSAGTTRATDFACPQFLLIDWGDYCTYYAERYNSSCHSDVPPADDYICWDRACLANEFPYSVCPCEPIAGTLICYCNSKGQWICTNPRATGYHGGNPGNVGTTKNESFSPRLAEDTEQSGNPTHATIEGRYYVRLLKPNGSPFVDRHGVQVYAKLFSLKAKQKDHAGKTFPEISFYAGVRVRRVSATYDTATVVGMDGDAYLVDYDGKSWVVRMRH